MKHSSELTRINGAVNSLLRRDKGGRKEEEDDYDPIAVESLRIFNALPLLQNREVRKPTHKHSNLSCVQSPRSNNYTPRYR